MKRLIIYCLSFLLLISFGGCMENYLDLYPEDKITAANFPEKESDIKLLLDGTYACLRETAVIDQGLFGFGMTDCATPNAYNWGTVEVFNKLGAGRLSSSDGGVVTFRWKRCYEMISRANYLLACLEKIELAGEAKKLYVGEAHFLRGLAYSVLAETYGGVPVVLSEISTSEARNLKRSSREDTWQQALDDYDVAIANLGADAPEKGRATKGAALGMKMRAYLYQGKYKAVLECVDQIDALKKYGLFHSYETVDGSPIDPENPYENRDPRLAFTVVLPGSYILGHRFPSYLYPGGAFNHAGNRLKHLSTRKYRIQNEADLPPAGQSYINDIILRYADVLLSKAEAIIESGGNVSEAIAILNRIRTERDDVKISPLPLSLSRDEAREKLRHERRIELALEGRYWSDVKRWKIGKELYPMIIKDHEGSVIETKFPNGYLEYYDLLPIPDSERSLNPNLEQNPGW